MWAVLKLVAAIIVVVAAVIVIDMMLAQPWFQLSYQVTEAGGTAWIRDDKSPWEQALRQHDHELHAIIEIEEDGLRGTDSEFHVRFALRGLESSSVIESIARGDAAERPLDFIGDAFGYLEVNGSLVSASAPTVTTSKSNATIESSGKFELDQGEGATLTLGVPNGACGAIATRDVTIRTETVVVSAVEPQASYNTCFAPSVTTTRSARSAAIEGTGALSMSLEGEDGPSSTPNVRFLLLTGSIGEVFWTTLYAVTAALPLLLAFRAFEGLDRRIGLSNSASRLVILLLVAHAIVWVYAVLDISLRSATSAVSSSQLPISPPDNAAIVILIASFGWAWPQCTKRYSGRTNAYVAAISIVLVLSALFYSASATAGTSASPAVLSIIGVAAMIGGLGCIALSRMLSISSASLLSSYILALGLLAVSDLPFSDGIVPAASSHASGRRLQRIRVVGDDGRGRAGYAESRSPDSRYGT